MIYETVGSSETSVHISQFTWLHITAGGCLRACWESSLLYKWKVFYVHIICLGSFSIHLFPLEIPNALVILTPRCRVLLEKLTGL
jgi:hypothetical protein